MYLSDQKKEFAHFVMELCITFDVCSDRGFSYPARSQQKSRIMGRGLFLRICAGLV